MGAGTHRTRSDGSGSTVIIGLSVAARPRTGTKARPPADFGSNVGQECATSSLTLPLRSFTSRARFGFCVPKIRPYLVPQFGEWPGQAPRVHPINRSTPAVTSYRAGALVVPVLVRFDNAGAGGGHVRGASEPIWTVTGKDDCALGRAQNLGGPRREH